MMSDRFLFLYFLNVQSVLDIMITMFAIYSVVLLL